MLMCMCVYLYVRVYVPISVYPWSCVWKNNYMHADMFVDACQDSILPTAQEKASILPSVCAQISGPVPLMWASLLAGLSHWFAYKTRRPVYVPGKSTRIHAQYRELR